MGLCDPLLARGPVADPSTGRVGHAARHAPDGYLESLRTGENRIRDPDLRAYYERLRLLTRGPIFRRERIAAIAGFLRGDCDALLARYAAGPYRAEMRHELPIDDVSAPRAEGTPWFGPGLQVLEAALTILLPTPSHAPRVEVALDANDRYFVAFSLGSEFHGWVDVAPSAEDGEAGLRVHELAVPEAAIAAGYDRIGVAPQAGDGIFTLGHLRLLDGGG
jgi:arabinofuranosyltransferase